MRFVGNIILLAPAFPSQYLDMDLMELLKQAQRLTNETNTDTEVPGVERTMSQVLQATKEFHSRVTQMGTNDLQA